MNATAVPFELALLARAANYQRWVADTVAPHLGRRILEIGAGIGNMSRWLPRRELLVLSEADPALLPLLRETAAREFSGDSRVSVQLLDLAADGREGLRHHDFDTIVSFNVLEHLEDDLAAVQQLVALLVESAARGPKRLVSFVPAHPWAFGAIDEAYGHFRRYSAHALHRLMTSAAPGCRYFARHFNVFGLPGWIVLGRMLRRARIDPAAVAAFERLCPYLRGLDDFLHVRLKLALGQSLVAVAELPG